MKKFRQFSCPRCGSNDLRASSARTVKEHLWALFGYDAAFCRGCRHRVFLKTFPLNDWFNAKCPRCFRTDLSTWNPQNYIISTWTEWMLALGAGAYRCEGCRHNFTSFRPRKRRRRRHSETERGVESGEAKA